MMTPPSTDYSAAAPGRSPGRTGVTPILHSSRCIGAALFRSPHRNGKARGRSPRRNGAALSHSPRRGGTDPDLPPARLYLPLLRHSPELPRHPPWCRPGPSPHPISRGNILTAIASLRFEPPFLAPKHAWSNGFHIHAVNCQSSKGIDQKLEIKIRKTTKEQHRDEGTSYQNYRKNVLAPTITPLAPWNICLYQ